MQHIPRDPSQPRSGSINDVHNEAINDDEVADLFSTNIMFRPRAHTCPENRAWLRRAKIKARNRPPTPPPTGISEKLMDIEHNISTHRDNLKLNSSDIPACIPEMLSPLEAESRDNTFIEENIFHVDEPV